MSFFSSDAFLTALARDYYQAGKIELKLYEVHGRQVRLAKINNNKVITDGPFYDYVDSVHSQEGVQDRISYIPKIVTSPIALDDEDPAGSMPPTTQEPAPLIEWTRFSTWGEYLALVRKRSKGLLPDQRRRLARMTEAYGEPPVFTFNHPKIEALEVCLEWKIQQYEGGHETLEDPRAVDMLRGLFESGHLILSTLEVADEYVAVQVGFLFQDEYLSLIPAYDPTFAKYGVGKELLLRTLEYSYGLGHRRFDFLQGAEPYKWSFATHVHLIESRGNPSLPRRANDVLEQLVKQGLLALSPRLFHRVKRAVISGRRNLAQPLMKPKALTAGFSKSVSSRAAKGIGTGNFH